MTADLDLVSRVLPQQLAWVDRDGCVLYANPAFIHEHSWEEKPLVGVHIRDVIGAELYGQYEVILGEILGRVQIETSQTVLGVVNGRSVKSMFTSAPDGGCLLSTELGPKHTFHGDGMDYVQERLKAFVNFAPIGIVFSHSDGRLFEANDAFLQLVGYSREELEQGEIHWDVITPPEYLHLDYEAIAEAKRLGYCRAYEKEYFNRSGARIPILIGFVMFGLARDEAVAFIVDLTGQKQAEEEVRRLNLALEHRVAVRTNELELANRELEAFCYSVSHDLRAPLRSVDGFAFALQQDYGEQLEQEAIEFINRIRTSAKRMDELITSLLSLSRVSTSEIARESINLTALADAIAKETQTHYPNRDVSFEIQEDLRTEADFRMMRAALNNLFDNALKFSAMTPKTRIIFGYDSDLSTYFIKDNGVGFDMNQSQKLFQPFERLHSPREFPGSGIGLATVQRIVRKHGGRIWAKGEVNRGATFFFTLNDYESI